MSLAEGAVPAGWPVVGPPTPRQRWLYRVVVALQVAAAGAGLFVVLGFGGFTGWRQIVAGAGVVLLLATASYCWWSLLRGEPTRIVRPGRTLGGTTRSQNLLRRTLRSGDELGDRDRCRIAAQLAVQTAMRPAVAVQSCMAGPALLGLSTSDAKALPVLVPVWAVVAAGALAQPAWLLWLDRVRRPAEAARAVPARVSG